MNSELNNHIETLDSHIASSIDNIEQIIGETNISYDAEDKAQQIIDLLEEVRGLINE